MTYDLSRDQWHVACTMLLSQNTCMHVCPCTRTRAHTHTQWGFTLIFFALCALLLTIAYRACHSSGTFSSLWHTRSRVHADKETQKEISQFALSDIHFGTIGLASDDVTRHSNAWQRWKLVLNKDSAPHKSMLGEKSLTRWSSLFLRGEVCTVLKTPSQLSASHFKRYRGSDKCGAVFRSINDLPACYCMGRSLFRTNFAGCWVVT